jgi:hypothetical protein
MGPGVPSRQLGLQHHLEDGLVAALLLGFLVLVGAEEPNRRAVVERQRQLRLVGLDVDFVAARDVEELRPEQLLRAQAVDAPDADEAARVEQRSGRAVPRPHRRLAGAAGAEGGLVDAGVVPERQLLVEELLANARHHFARRVLKQRAAVELLEKRPGVELGHVILAAASSNSRVSSRR